MNVSKFAPLVLASGFALGCSKGTEAPPQRSPLESSAKNPEHGTQAAPANPHAEAPVPAAQSDELQAEASNQIGPIKIETPQSWTRTKPANSMRAAQFTMQGGGSAGELVVTYFGPNGAGGLEANLKRWYSQFVQPDGSSSADAAKTKKREVNGLKVTTVDLGGTFASSMRPGGQQKTSQENAQMLAAIVETSEGPYYFKLVGPKALVEANRAQFEQFIATMKPAQDN